MIEEDTDDESVQVGWIWVHKSCTESLRRWLETHPNKNLDDDNDE